MKAIVFPGQGAQFTGMGKDLYDNNEVAREMMEKANEILGFRLTDVMFEGDAEALKQTKVTQPAVFLHSVVLAKCMGEEFCPDMVGGHSLGEFSALVAAGVLDFADGLKLVYARALAMQKACEAAPGGMAAVMRLDNEKIEQICTDVTAQAGKGVVVAANYNCPGQLVISGNKEAVEAACEKLLEAGARRAMMLPVGGAFHSPLMQSAKNELEAAIAATEFHEPACPVYQNVDGKAHTNPEEIKQNLIAQLTASVRWTQEVEAMVEAGATEFVECGPGQALTGMITKIAKDAVVMHA